MSTLQLVTILKALNEVALFSLLGLGLLYVLAGQRRDRNLIYQLLHIVARPALALARFISPRVILDKHIGLVAFFLTVLVELALIVWKARLLFPVGH